MNALQQLELRRHPRNRVLKDGKIIAVHSSVVIDVTIRDLSIGGARIRIPAGTDIPREFSLAILSEQLLYPARECWRRGDYMGVEFIGEPQRAALRHWKHSAPTQKDTAAAKRATITPDLIMNATEAGDGILFQAKFRLRYEDVPSRAWPGSCFIDVLLQNNGLIAAHFPFFCLPLLGLNMKPAPGWAQQDLALVRKFRRFSRLDAIDLDPGAAIHCCTIGLAFNAARGGRFEFEKGCEHSFGNLPDLKLMCVAGAGNYSSQRTPFVVPAIVLKTLIGQQVECGVISNLAPGSKSAV